MALPSPQRLYFAYGSSLSQSEMISRCPTSTFYSIAVLRNHRWFVNERGNANVIPSLAGPNEIEDVVWGILYTLRPFDEELLDKHEGIPWAYSKADMDVEAVSISEDARGTRREVVRALVYIDREKVQESYPWPEFMVKMNKGIQEAVERGLPRTWVDRVVRTYMVDPSAANGTDAQVEAERVPSVHDPARPASITNPDSDRASHTQESLVRGHFVNGGSQNGRSSQVSQSLGPEDSFTGGQFVRGGSQKGRSIHIGQLDGLEKSKYAHEGGMSGAQRYKAARERQAGGVLRKSPNPVTQDHGNKQLECWWWRVKGSCRYSDEECQFAHHETSDGVADAPGKKVRGHLPEGQRSSFQQRSMPRRWESQSTKAYAWKENEKQPYGYQQDWSGRQDQNEAKSMFSGKQSEQQDQNEAKSTSSGTQPEQQQQQQQQDQAEANPSWSDQVENLMDSEPEWLVANDRKDVKW
jgi:gamma-glutamylcyclotransferase